MSAAYSPSTELTLQLLVYVVGQNESDQRKSIHTKNTDISREDLQLYITDYICSCFWPNMQNVQCTVYAHIMLPI